MSTDKGLKSASRYIKSTGEKKNTKSIQSRWTRKTTCSFCICKTPRFTWGSKNAMRLTSISPQFRIILRSANCNILKGGHMGLNDIHSLSYTKWNCKYHIVFAPKYRRKVFYGQKDKRQVKYFVNCVTGKVLTYCKQRLVLIIYIFWLRYHLKSQYHLSWDISKEKVVR